jgi:hypothetical protein
MTTVLNQAFVLQVMQEAGEVIQEATKLLQFGDEATDPETDISYDNVARLKHEMADLFASLHTLVRDMEAKGKFERYELDNHINEKVAFLERRYG